MRRIKKPRQTHRTRTKGNSENFVNSVKVPSSLARRLLGWFISNARDLPWRRTLDPYAIWVSEIMLQQTQVKTVVPYFERWMRELPTVQALANASSEKIHKLWEGLGYYTRVRNMQKAAQLIMQKHGGRFPREFEAVFALPGIGRYTTGAICSIAFNAPAAILDGNVIRVLTRVFGIRENPREKQTNEQLWRLAEELVGMSASLSLPCGAEREKCSAALSSARLSGPCSALNQSLMELGATVCTAKQPKCSQCPIARPCVARRQNIAEQLPNPGERTISTARRFVACVIERGGAVLVRQRPEGMINAELWEFPNVELAMTATATRRRKALEAEIGCTLNALTPLITVKHTITRYRITLEALCGELNGALPRTAAGKWVSVNRLDTLPFTSAHRRVLAATLRRENDAPAAG